MEINRLIRKKQRAQKDENLRLQAESAKDLGDLYFESGELKKALNEYLDQLNACEALSDQLNVAVAHRMIGETYTNLGDYDDALTHLNSYLNVAIETENIVEQQRAYATLGRMYFCWAEALDEAEQKTKALNSAKKAYFKSLKLSRQLEFTNNKTIEVVIMQVRLFLNLGLVLEAQNEPNEAIEMMQKAIELATENQLKRDLHRIYLALGSLEERQNKYDEALKYYKESENITDDPVNITTACICRAELYLKLNCWSKARSILIPLYVNCTESNLVKTVSKLLKIAAIIDNNERDLKAETNNARKMILYETMGDAAAAGCCYEKAIEYYQGMLSCAEKEKNCPKKICEALASIAQTLKDSKRYEEALTFARRELEFYTNDDRETCRSASFIADLLTCICDSHLEIAEFYRLALSSAIRCNDLSLQRSVLKDQKRYYLSCRKTSEVNRIEKQIEKLNQQITCEDSSSDSDEDSDLDIDLDDLSDVENERAKKEGKKKTRSIRLDKKYIVKRNLKGETCLHTACINNNIGKVEQLLEAGHPLNERDNFGWTPLHEAANLGHVEITELLIKAGAYINDPGGPECRDITPLHDAASSGHCSVINLLIESGADVTLLTKDGHSVLKCFEDYRARVEKSRISDNVDWTTDDESDYQMTLSKLRRIIPRTSIPPKVSVGLNSSHCPLIDDDDDDIGTLSISNHEDLPVTEKISAGEDYKRTIESLKNRGRRFLRTKAESTKKSKITAPLVDSEQQLEDEWLEDDMDMLSSSSRNRSDVVTTNTQKECLTPDKEKSSKRSRRSDGSETSSSCFDRDGVSNYEDTNSTSFPTAKRPRLRQSSLKMSGFTKDVTRTNLPSSNYTCNQFNTVHTATSQSESLRLKITIEDRIITTKFKFTDDYDNLVKCLNKNVVEKFRQDTGCTAEITFFTMNDEQLTPENILNLVYTSNNDSVQLIGNIMNLEIPQISLRYKIISAALNTNDSSDDKTIVDALKICEQKNVFRMKNEDEVLHIIPLIKSLEYERNLNILSLSGNSLYSHGQLVNRTLNQLVQLQELHLQRCDIDQNFLMHINNFPMQLRILDLSYNPLGASSQSKINELIMPLRNLERLNMRSCQLEKVSFAPEFSLALEHLDISWNNIKDDEINHFLQRQLTNLNLSYTRQRSIGIIEPRPVAFVTIEVFELAGCNLNDSDVLNLLHNCQNISKVVLSDNPSISQIAIEALLERKPTLSLINAAGCSKISEKPKPNLIIDDPPVCTMIVNMDSDISAFWEELWQSYATQYKISFDTIIFKPSV